MTTILGLNAYHGDAAAAIVVDGHLIAAVEEERFNRIKHWAGFPVESIRWCLDFAGVRPEDLDHVAISFDPRVGTWRRIRFLAKHRPSLRAIRDRVQRQSKTIGLKVQLAEALGCSPTALKARIHRVEHHSAHIGAGFLISPFEEAAVLSVDGMGDFSSTVTAHARERNWRVLDRVSFPHSIGFLYTATTMYLGFPYYGDEYKVMGLAPYGEPEYADFFRKVIRPKGDTFELDLDYFTHQKGGIQMSWNEGAPVMDSFISDKFIRELGAPRDPNIELTQREDNIARSLQFVTEEVIMHLLNRLHDRTGVDQLCMTGGVAMNSVANGKITTQTPFKSVYVPAGAADNGTSFGAAFEVWCRRLNGKRQFVQDHAFWGCGVDEAECEAVLRGVGVPFERFSEDSLVAAVVDHILDGRVVGWFQGRMEFGARALGSRSLIADPRRGDMRDIINLRIKFREKFRPFAPSILEEHVADWFSVDEPSPYMERVLPIREERREEIPAVTHVDGSGRLQTVSKQANPVYHALITEFFRRTGVPILLNTSLNENEPVVTRPSEALSCFLRTDMDVLAMGPYVINRHSVEFPEEFKVRQDLGPGQLPSKRKR